MATFLQAAGAALIAVILCVMLSTKGKETGLLLSMGVCSMLCLVALRYLQPVLDFLDQLEDLGGLDRNLVGILLKAAGIGFLSEIAGLVCEDAGNKSMGKALQILGSGAILWLSIPLFQSLLDLIGQILGEV